MPEPVQNFNRNRALRSLWVLFGFVFVLDSGLLCQTLADSSLSGKPVSSVVVYGNTKTRPSVILREMELKPGIPFQPAVLEEDRKRIQNLGLFNRVLAQSAPLGDSVAVRIMVTEKYYLIPYPILFISDKDWGKISWGAGLLHFNVRGRAETLVLSFWLGYNPAVQITYANPWLGGARNFYGQTGFFYKKIRSKHFIDIDVTENHLGFQGSFGKRFGLFTYLHATAGYQVVSLSPAVPGETLSESGVDHLPSLGLVFTRDTRDLREYPRSGFYLSAEAVKTGFHPLSADYFRTRADIRTYFPFGRFGTLAARFLSSMSFGRIPVYGRVYIGYGDRIRGHFFEQFEGENMAFGSLAFRIPLVRVRHFFIGERPELSNLKWGIGLGLFTDTGMCWFQDEPMKASSLQSGWGLGLHIILPYVDLLRLELAFDEKWNAQWIADLSVDI